jgi:hypothetical protein
MARFAEFFGVLVALAFVLGARRSPAEAGGASRDRAAITLVADAARSPELRSVLNELLERDNIDAHFTERARFGSGELLDTDATQRMVGVFVVPSGGGTARVYFRAPDGERFLVRDVTLSSGFDALGRELIAQIVEASVVALLHSGVGLNRAQVKAELDAGADDDSHEDRTPKPAVAPKPGPGPALSPQERPRNEVLLEGWLAARYAAEWSGSALGIGHGPGLELGLGVRWRVLLRARLILEQDFPVGLSAGPIDARITTSRWRTALDVGAALGKDSALALSIGVGQDASRVEPTGSRDPNVIPAAASREAPMIMNSGVRFEAGTAKFQITLAAGLDVPLVHTPYDVDRGANAKQLAEPWLVRPNAALSLAWRPELGWF